MASVLLVRSEKRAGVESDSESSSVHSSPAQSPRAIPAAVAAIAPVKKGPSQEERLRDYSRVRAVQNQGAANAAGVVLSASAVGAIARLALQPNPAALNQDELSDDDEPGRPLVVPAAAAPVCAAETEEDVRDSQQELEGQDEGVTPSVAKDEGTTPFAEPSAPSFSQPVVRAPDRGVTQKNSKDLVTDASAPPLAAAIVEDCELDEEAYLEEHGRPACAAAMPSSVVRPVVVRASDSGVEETDNKQAVTAASAPPLDKLPANVRQAVDQLDQQLAALKTDQRAKDKQKDDLRKTIRTLDGYCQNDPSLAILLKQDPVFMRAWRQAGLLTDKTSKCFTKLLGGTSGTLGDLQKFFYGIRRFLNQFPNQEAFFQNHLENAKEGVRLIRLSETIDHFRTRQDRYCEGRDRIQRSLPYLLLCAETAEFDALFIPYLSDFWSLVKGNNDDVDRNMAVLCRAIADRLVQSMNASLQQKNLDECWDILNQMKKSGLFTDQEIDDYVAQICQTFARFDEDDRLMTYLSARRCGTFSNSLQKACLSLRTRLGEFLQKAVESTNTQEIEWALTRLASSNLFSRQELSENVFQSCQRVPQLIFNDWVVRWVRDCHTQQRADWLHGAEYARMQMEQFEKALEGQELPLIASMAPLMVYVGRELLNQKIMTKYPRLFLENLDFVELYTRGNQALVLEIARALLLQLGDYEFRVTYDPSSKEPKHLLTGLLLRFGFVVDYDQNGRTARLEAEKRRAGELAEQQRQDKRNSAELDAYYSEHRGGW